MATRFAYYPGCIAEFSSKELDATTKALAPMLDIELLPMPAATCCGAGDIAEAKPNLYLTLNVRILSPGRGDGRRHPHHLQRLHAQPAPGEQDGQGGRRACSSRSTRSW